MSKELEIEFKNMLQKEEYEKLAAHYGFSESDVKTQENFYFDTPDFQLKNLKSALRIRKNRTALNARLKLLLPTAISKLPMPWQKTRQQP
ncbi:CYTH domain-containing protein [Planococcus koreensis]|uniref:CYTH domain-containing protein n=1 Tax=Planococcus koreensis TaxID=112331 RepID=UPI0039FD1EAB